MIILDYPIKALCGGMALLLLFALNLGLRPSRGDVQLEMMAHICKTIYYDIRMLPPRSLAIARTVMAVAIVKVIIQPVVETLL